MAIQLWVNRVYSRGLSTHPWGAPVWKSGIAYLHHLWSACQEVHDTAAQGGTDAQVMEPHEKSGQHSCATVGEQHPHMFFWSRWEKAVYSVNAIASSVDLFGL